MNEKLVVMGPSGAGKTTIGTRLAQELGQAHFMDGDALHPPSNVEKMRAGVGLSDADRFPWLSLVASWLAQDNQTRIVACSALKTSYRDFLTTEVERLSGTKPRFVYLKVDKEELKRRLSTRAGHFAGVALLESQLSTLEEPQANVFDGHLPTDELVEQICDALAIKASIE